MTASDTPEPTREELDRADRSLRDEQLSPTSRMTWHHLVHERAALTAARARIEQLEAEAAAGARAFAEQGADLQRALGRIEQLGGALRDLQLRCNHHAEALAQPPAVAPEPNTGTSGYTSGRKFWGVDPPRSTDSSEAESGPPILPHNPEHEATVDALVARKTAERKAESGLPWPCMCGMSINTGPRCSMCGSERDADSSEGQPAGHSAYDTKRCPACNDNGRACAWCGEDGPTGEGQPATDRAALIDKIMDRRAPAMEMLAASPGQPTPEPCPHETFDPDGRCHDCGGPTPEPDHRIGHVRPTMLERNTATTQLLNEWPRTAEAPTPDSLSWIHVEERVAHNRERLARETAERINEELQSQLEREYKFTDQATKRAEAAERERDHERKRGSTHIDMVERVNAEINAQLDERGVDPGCEGAPNSMARVRDRVSCALAKLAAAERRASEAEERLTHASIDSSYDQGRAAAFAEVVKEMDRYEQTANPAFSVVREWVDRQRSLAEGRVEG